MARQQATSSFELLSRGLNRTRGKMNANETKWATELQNDPKVAWFKFEPLSLYLSHPDKGQPARLKPDFLVVMNDGTTYLDDVKSGGMDDNAALVRMRAAAELYPIWIFRLVKPKPRKVGGGFDVKEL